MGLTTSAPGDTLRDQERDLSYLDPNRVIAALDGNPDAGWETFDGTGG